MNAVTTPLLLEDCVAAAPGILVKGRLLAYPHHWQVPAATEKAAFEAVAGIDLPDFAYVGFPWATVIDGLRNDAPQTWDLLRGLDSIRGNLSAMGVKRCASVGQHINADRFIGLFKAAGVTDLFWSHARSGQTEIDGVTIHPFPLFPAQTPDGPEPGDPHRPRRYVANFIGAYNPKVYLTDVREHIFGDEGASPDLLIIRREAWHFDRTVYSEQMRGLSPDQARLALEARHKDEYLTAMRDSLFTLCPSGSGPNSIRIAEALALASIPIILTRDLALPGDPALWERACLIEDDSVDGYRRSLARARSMSVPEARERQRATKELFAAIGPPAYGDLIATAMAAK